MKAAATTFRANPAFDTEKAIMELGTGEALVSTLDDRGQPTIVQRTLVRPPNSRVGPITDAELKAAMRASPVAGVYDETVDRESASEILEKRGAEHADADTEAKDEKGAKSGGSTRTDGFWSTFGKQVIRAVVPAATRMAEKALKDSMKRGGR